MELTAVTADIGRRHGIRLDPETARAVGGGCINRCWALAGDDARWFLKVNRRSRARVRIIQGTHVPVGNAARAASHPVRNMIQYPSGPQIPCAECVQPYLVRIEEDAREHAARQGHPL